MRDTLLRAIRDPYFKTNLLHGVNGLIESARILTRIGIDVNKLVMLALKDINSQLNDAAYEITDLDALLKESQAIGDEVVEKPQTEKGPVTPTPTEKDDNQSKGNFGESG